MFKGISICRVMFPLGLTVLFVTIAAYKAPSIDHSGHGIFMERCGACHGEDGKGNGPAVGSLKIAPADLTLLAQRRGTFAATVASQFNRHDPTRNARGKILSLQLDNI